MTQEQIDLIYNLGEKFVKSSSSCNMEAHDAACATVAPTMNVDVLKDAFQAFKERPSALNYRRLSAVMDVWQFIYAR
jgi:hypothetical protein